MTGQQLGHYRVGSKLGEGGMGVVYRAHDTRLGRDVAIKVLPDAVARDPERLARFEREARTLAALNHPNIAAVYGVEQGALVMELVEGETLKGPLPVDTAINYARQIAEALQAAHDKGIIHRDLKPANIKITPEGKIKLLDFGLAKAVEAQRTSAPENTPTQTAATESGLIMGTAGYMSPEQARGSRVDHRTDIWAFGVVLYEMATGAKLFKGPTAPDMLAAVLSGELTLNEAPARLRSLLQRCLERDANKRLGWIGDIDWGLDASSEHRAALPRWVIPAVAAAALAAGAAVWFLRPSNTNRELPLRVFSFTPPKFAQTPFCPSAAISPNGRYIAYAADSKLWIRDLASEQVRALEGTEGADHPFWSPDSNQIAFITQNGLKGIALAGGAPFTIAKVPISPFRGAAWSPDGKSIVVSLMSQASPPGLSEVPASGGTLKQVFGTPKGTTFYCPAFLPGEGRLLLAGKGSATSQVLELIDLISGKSWTLRRGAWPAWSATGHILYRPAARMDGLWALPFSPSKRSPTGEPVPVLNTGSDFSVAEDGTLIWTDSRSWPRLLAWIDRSGKRETLPSPPGAEIKGISLSPDGTRVAYSDEEQDNRDVFTLDLKRLVRTRFTNAPEVDDYELWSPSGSEIAFSSVRSGGGDIYVQPADGSAEAKPVVSSPLNEFPQDWSPDGRLLLFGRVDPTSGMDLWTVRRRPDGSFEEPSVWLQSPFDEYQASFSPNGRHVLYVSRESGYPEVYVRSFPAGGRKRQISSGRGFLPRWSRDGKEIFYIHEGVLYAVSVDPDLVSIGQALRLFPVGSLQAKYGVSPDGKRFLFAIQEDGEAAAIHIVQNWPALLRKQ